MNKKQIVLFISIIFIIIGFLAYITIRNFNMNWTGSPYDPGYQSNGFSSNINHPTSPLWDYVDFQGNDIGLTVLTKMVFVSFGINTPNILDIICKFPFSLIVWISICVLFYIWIGRLFFKDKKNNSPINLAIIALLAAFIMPATAMFHISQFFFSNALYGFILLFMTSILALDFNNTLGRQRMIIAFIIICATLIIYHTADQVILIMVFIYALVLFLFRFLIKSKIPRPRLTYNSMALFTIGLIVLSYLIFVFHSLFTESVDWARQDMVSPLSLGSFFGRLSLASPYISFPHNGELITLLISLLTYLVLMLLMIIIAFVSKQIPFHAKLGLMMLLAFLGILLFVFIYTLGLGSAYQRIFDYSLIVLIYLFSIIIYSLREKSIQNNSYKSNFRWSLMAIGILSAVVFISTIANRDYLSVRENYSMEYSPNTSSVLAFFTEHGSPPIFATLKTSLNYLMVNKRNDAYVIFDPMVETGQSDYIMILDKVLYSVYPDSSILLQYMDKYGMDSPEAILIVSDQDYKIGWIGFNGFYKPITADFTSDTGFDLVYDNGETKSYAVLGN